MSALLEAENMHAYYGKSHILYGVSLTVAEGEIVTLLGRNGAGKTTTLRAITGLTSPRQGRVRLAGADVTGTPTHRIAKLGVGYVFEGRRVFRHLTVDDNLRVPGETPGRWNKATIYALFPRLGERRTSKAGRLSGGEQEMLAIARALLLNPRLLLLDEPSMGLAPLLVQQIFEIIGEINGPGTTVLLVEQNASQALSIAHRGYVLETGSIVMSDAASALLVDPRVKAAYLGEGAA